MRKTVRSVAIALVGFCMTSATPAQQADVLSNADIVTLTEAGLAPAAIVAAIEVSGADRAGGLVCGQRVRGARHAGSRARNRRGP